MDTDLNFDDLRKAPHWSFSALNSVLNICSLQYAFGRVYKEEPEFTPINLVFGSAFHRGAGFLFNMLKSGSEPSAAELADFFAKALVCEVENSRAPVQFGKDKSIEEYTAKGSQMLQVLKDDFSPDDKIIDTDVPFRVDLLDASGKPVSKPLIGEYDAVVENKGQLIVVDFKTAAAKWPAQKCHSDLQATAYLYALRQDLEQRENLFRYDVITKTKTPTVTRYLTNRTQADFDRFIHLVKIADAVVEQGLYYPHETSFACSGCPHSTACSQWNAQVNYAAA
jgi:hypothetical protein